MKFFKKIGDWWSRHKPTKRRLIQLYAALLTNANLKGFFTGSIYTGAGKSFCVPGLNCYSCPGAAGACPLGALQNALTQSKTSSFYYVIGILVLFGLLLGRTICGFLCPFGLGQELLYKIPAPKLKKSRFTRILSYLKYIILLVFVVVLPVVYSQLDRTIPAFCKFICPAGTFGGALGLLVNPANAGLFEMLGPLFTWKFIVLVAFCVACVFIFRAFCRFFCPLGAIYGFFNRFALLGVKLDKDACTNCGLCVSHCKMDVKRVGDHECINCGECISVCPAKAISWKGSKLFVRANETPALADAPAEEVRPLGALLKNEDPAEQLPQEAAQAAETSEQEQAAETSGQEQAAEAAVPRKKRGRGFWLQLAAWAVALAVLVAALVCFNFLDREEKDVYGIGDTCPDFVVPVLQGEGETFKVSEHRGHVLLLNFWTTYCDPCKQEIPYFEQIANEYAGDVTVAIVHGTDVVEDVPAFIVSIGWGDYRSYFLQDTEQQQMYAKLGGRGTWPMTLLLDGDGVICAVHQGEVSYELICSELDVMLGN